MEYQNPYYESDSEISKAAIASYMTRVFGLMTFALTVTALTAWLTANSPLIEALKLSPMIFYGLIIGELLLVGFLVGLVNKMNAILATIIYIAYAILNGITFSVILLAFPEADIALCFFITAGTFAFMAAYGYFTNNDLSSLGSFLIMALVGILIASLANFFMKSEMLYWIISYVGLFIFIGLTAYDTQKIKNQALLMSQNGETMQKGAIMGALTLYLDFINLFIFILRIFGRR